MINFLIYEHDTKTNKNILMDEIEARNILEAKKEYIEKTRHKAKEDVKILVRSPLMR